MFLTNQIGYKNMHDYKPLLDDSFERGILGDEHYEKLQKTAKESLADKK